MGDVEADAADRVRKAVGRLLEADSWTELKSTLVEEAILRGKPAHDWLISEANGAAQEWLLDLRIRMLVLAAGLQLCAEQGIEKGLDSWVAWVMRDLREFTQYFKQAMQGDPEIDLLGEIDLAREILWLARFKGGPFSEFWEPVLTQTMALIRKIPGPGAKFEIYRWLSRNQWRQPSDSPTWSKAVADLALSAQEMFRTTGQTKYIEESINLFRHSIARRDDAMVRTNLARSLLLRYEQSGSEPDVATAAVLAADAAKELKNPTDRAWALDVSGMALKDGFIRAGDARALDLAISQQTQAVEIAPADSPLRPAHLGNLAGSLLQRYMFRMDESDLARAIELFREEVSLCRRGHELLPDALANLSAALLVDEEARPDAVSEAGEKLREAISLAGSASTVPLWRANLSKALLRSGDAVAASREIETALAALAEGNPLRAALRAWQGETKEALSQDPLADYRATIDADANHVSAAIRAALQGADWATRHEDIDAAREFFGRGLTLADELANRQQKITDQLSWRRSVSRIVDDGAVTMALAGYVDEAIQHLERGRAAILRQALLGGSEPQDQDKFTGNQPLIFLVAGKQTGVAIFIHKQAHSVVRLPALTKEALWERLIKLSSAQAARFGAGGAIELSKALDETADWLWRSFFEPLIEKTGPLPSGLTLAVDGLLASLPFSAARSFNGKSATPGNSVVDTTALTIVPTALSLKSATLAASNAPQKSLSVVVDKIRGLPDLVWAASETKEISALLPDCSTLKGKQASVRNVLETMAEIDILHVAAHGKADLIRPLESGLFLADGQMLTVSDLIKGPRRARRLAVLSACETSVPGVVTPTEAIGLPAAFLGLGFAGVIGTLWPVSDAAARLVIPRALRQWLIEKRPLPEAVADAQRWLRTLGAEEAEDLLRQPVASERPFDSIRSWGAFTFCGA